MYKNMKEQCVDTEFDVSIVNNKVIFRKYNGRGDEEIVDGSIDDSDKNFKTTLDSTISIPSNSRMNNRASMSSETPVRQILHDREFYSAHKGADSE
eukprot:Awhi_evm1s5944